LALALAAAVVWANNSSWLASPPPGGPKVLAHRGLGQTFSLEGVKSDTDTSKRIYPPEHPFLENTIPGIEAAFRYGADVVEIDIHPTSDGQFAVFHDWTLDFRTDGSGVTREFPLSYLKTLDVGYGYSADGGQTYPFRGKGIGLMPSLDEVLGRFQDREFLIHVKSNDSEEGTRLAAYLTTLPPGRLDLLTVYGGDRPVAVVEEAVPHLRTMSRASLKGGLLRYIAAGWTGYVPEACRGTQVHIPQRFAPWLWGWPDRFQRRMEAAGTRVVLVGGAGGWSAGFDSEADLVLVPEGFAGWVWTNRVDRVGPLLRPGAGKPAGS
jgi:glycerophosphoryl diester phosphodiesterase